MSVAAVMMLWMDIARLLDFEATWPRHTSAKEELIRDELRITPPRYYQLLDRAAASLEGQAHDPLTAHRILRRMKRPRRIA
jgi:hypothetical protein